MSYTSNAPSPLNFFTTYFVVGATADNFLLSATQGGGAIDISATGTTIYSPLSTPSSLTHKALLLALLAVGCTTSRASLVTSDLRPDAAATARVKVGRFASRGLWTPSKTPAPAILLLPGSGPQGPEELIPASMTADGRDAALFAQVSRQFIDAGFNVLALGKPGVEFFSGWETPQRFYDVALLQNLSWPDLVDNAVAGVEFLKQQASVTPGAIFVLGHSEGTQVATDVAQRAKLAGLILLGYSGEDLITTVKWQLFEREIEYFLRTDLDANQDGFVTRSEAAAWHEFSRPWQQGQERLPNAEIEAVIRGNAQKHAYVEQLRSSPMCKDGGCERGPFYARTAAFSGPIFAFTGELDLQTRAAEAVKLRETCVRLGKLNCRVEVIPGVQHGSSPPRAPRRHPVFDATVGPMEPSFLARLKTLAQSLSRTEAP